MYGVYMHIHGISIFQNCSARESGATLPLIYCRHYIVREREKRKWCKQKKCIEENRADCRYNAIAFYMHVLYLDCPFKKNKILYDITLL